MDEQEYQRKYSNLRVLKSIRDYLKSEGDVKTAVYPVRVPDDMMYQELKRKGAEHLDGLIHEIFQLGLKVWSEKLYQDEFGSEERLQDFIEMMKKRGRE